MSNIKIYAENLEAKVHSQIETLGNDPLYCNSKIRIMPDCHYGASGPIGLTMPLTDTVNPALVGSDIGCGVLVIKLKETNIDLDSLDINIRSKVESVHAPTFDLNKLRCLSAISIDKAQNSLGTLGGGNHFIEIDKGKDGSLYLVIHSGSRYLGYQVAKHYQNLAEQTARRTPLTAKRKILIAKLKARGRDREIQSELQKLKVPVTQNTPHLKSLDFDNYIHDINIVQNYATVNRQVIANLVLHAGKLHIVTYFESVHNYIDTKHLILRKGAISAQKGESIVIPLNMRDGVIIGTGKGNIDWNYSAPHGAGRRLSRTKAKQQLDLKEFKEQMKGICSTSVNEYTLDEAPGAYKPFKDIVRLIEPTVDVLEILKPIYSYKTVEHNKRR